MKPLKTPIAMSGRLQRFIPYAVRDMQFGASDDHDVPDWVRVDLLDSVMWSPALNFNTDTEGDAMSLSTSDKTPQSGLCIHWSHVKNRSRSRPFIDLTARSLFSSIVKIDQILYQIKQILKRIGFDSL